jgi:hypothetical protein
MAQVVEHLPSNLKALSTNTNAAKRKINLSIVHTTGYESCCFCTPVISQLNYALPTA